MPLRILVVKLQDMLPFTSTRNNPGFFKGTVVEQAVADELGPGKSIARCDRIDESVCVGAEPWKGMRRRYNSSRAAETAVSFQISDLPFVGPSPDQSLGSGLAIRHFALLLGPFEVRLTIA